MKKNFTQILAFCALLFTYSNSSSQNALLKDFINENDIAIRSVQKYSIIMSDPTTDATIKNLLALQVASVKTFKSDAAKSADLAYMIREKCTVFLTQNSKGSLDFLKLTDKESAFFSSPKPVEKPNSLLKKSELDKINSIDTKDPHLFDGMNTRIN
jgi:hypothetical protein